jgi:hypothetical protein
LCLVRSTICCWSGPENAGAAVYRLAAISAVCNMALGIEDSSGRRRNSIGHCDNI